jgi:hypothetical protein
MFKLLTSQQKSSYKPITFGFICLATIIGIFTSWFVLKPTLLSPHLLTTWDGMLHTAIANSILHYGLPPKTLYFHPEPMLYHWVGDLIMLLFNLIFTKKEYLFQSWPYFSLFTAFLTLTSAYYLSRQNGFDRNISLVTAFFTLFGLNIFLFAIYMNKDINLTISFTTYDLIHQGFSWNFDGRISLTKFFDPSAYPLAFPTSLLFVSSILKLIKSSHNSYYSKNYLKYLLLSLLTGCFLFLINVLSGIAIIVSTLLGILFLISVKKINCNQNLKRTVKIAGPLFLILLINWVFLKFLLPEAGDVRSRIFIPFTSKWNYQPNMLGGLIIPGFLSFILLFMSLSELKKFYLHLPYHYLLLFIISLGCSALSFFIFPSDNQYKFIFHFFHFSLIASMGIFIKSYRKKNALFMKSVLTIFVAIVAINGVICSLSYSRVPQPGGNIELTQSEYHLSRWMKRNTPQNSLFLELTSRPYSIAAALANRPSYMGFSKGLKIHGYNENKMHTRHQNMLDILASKDLEKAKDIGIRYVICDDRCQDSFVEYKDKIVYFDRQFVIFDLM